MTVSRPQSEQIPTFTGPEAADSLRFTHEILGSAAMQGVIATHMVAGPLALQLRVQTADFNLVRKQLPVFHPAGTVPEKPIRYDRVRERRRQSTIDPDDLLDLADFANQFRADFPIRRIAVRPGRAAVHGALGDIVPLDVQRHLLALIRPRVSRPDLALHGMLSVGRINVEFMPFMSENGRLPVGHRTYDGKEGLPHTRQNITSNPKL